MKKITGLLHVVSLSLFAQLTIAQNVTPFDRFISKPGIEWAAYINDTIRFKKPNVNIILLNRITLGEIPVALPVETGSLQLNQISYLKKKEINDRLLYTSNRVAMYDSMGNFEKDVIMQSAKIDTADFSLLNVKQILYVENGQLRTYTAWVSPMRPVKTSIGIFLGQGDFFSSCFNFNYNYRSARSNKVVWLGLHKRKIILDSILQQNKLKELYGRNLLATIWPNLLNKKISIFNYDTKIPVYPNELTTDLINEYKIPIQLYDSTGNIIGQRFASQPLSPTAFTTMELVQNWYYDRSSNIVFSTIREAYLYAKKWTTTGQALYDSPILKIVFQ